MKKPIDVPVVNKERDITLVKRREDYALNRDLQASDNNNAITKRLLSEKMISSICVKCGMEFPQLEISGDFRECPACR